MMMQTIIDFLGINNFIPHGYCLSWSSSLLWLHVVSGSVTALSYFLIPLVIFSFIRQRKDIPYSNVFLMFCAFIVACGMTHVISIITIWIPVYWLDGWVKALTATLSLLTLCVVFRVVPQALQLPNTVAVLRNEIQEREKAEHAKNIALTALQASEERLRLVLEGAELGFWDWDIETDKVERNEIWARMLGFSHEDVNQTSHQWSELIHPDDKEKVWQSVTDTLEGRSLVHKIEYRMFHTDGSIKWVLDHGSVMQFDANGKASRMSGTQTDITERKHAEEALLRSRHDLNRAQAVAHIGSWRMDICNNHLSWSDETYRIFGLPTGTPLTYQSFLEIVHPADRAFVDVAWQEALTGKPYDIEHRLLIDQKIRWVRELAELEYDKQGLLLGAFGTTEDITDIKSSQEALQQERTFLRQVIDTVPSVIFVKDRDGRFLLCNEALAQSYGASLVSLIGMKEENFNSNADEVAHFQRVDLEAINTRNSLFIPEVNVTHADGSLHWYNTVKIPLVEEDKCDKLLVVATDITDRKRAEEALLLADRRKDEFLAMLAHELRNPLAPIRNAVEFLKLQQSTDPKQAWGLNIIGRQVSHIARMLDDLLDVARILHGKITLKTETFELAEIVNAAIEASRPLIEQNGQVLIVSNKITHQWIVGDRMRLAQVLSNLLNNATKYTGEGGKIYLTVSREDSNAVIEIRDTGIGIPSGTLSHIFDLFIQADNSLAHSQGGLGIGLTLVRRLTEMHGGSVSAASPGIGKGSSFVVRLPCLPLKSSPLKSSTHLSAALPMSKFRILIVDDYADVTESLTMLLEIYGHELKSADCGAKAIECAQVFSPQVVLIDIGLPDMNGYEVAKRLRRLPVTQDALLIALSGYGMAVGGELSKSSEFNHYLLKPLEFEKLLIILNGFQHPSG